MSDHGGSVHQYRRNYGTLPLDFSANINPLGMPDAIAGAIQDALVECVHYPDPDCTALRAAIAKHEGIQADWVLCGNGAADLIFRFSYALCPKAALVCAPTFSEYATSLRAAGCKVVEHALLEVDGFQVTETILDVLDGIETLFLCNPNNPTGLTVEPALLFALLDACKEKYISVLLDECFIDFLDDPTAHTCVSYLEMYPNVVVLKAFTKLYAMPGIRLGYALCSDVPLLERMKGAGAPWSVSTVAQAAGIAALSAWDYVMEARVLIKSERVFMKQMLRNMGIDAIGEANYLFFKAERGLAHALQKESLLIRDCGNFAGLEGGFYRIAVRTRPENMRLLSTLGRLCHG